MHRIPRADLIALLVTLTLWASAFAGIRAGLRDYSASHLALLRFLAASATMAVYALLGAVRLPRRRDLPLMLLMGFVSVAFYHVSLNHGEKTVTAGAASMLIASTPVWAALLARFFFRDRLRTWGWVGIAVSFVGVVLIALGEEGGLRFGSGAVWILAAALSSGISILLQKTYLARYSPTEMAAHMVWSGTAMLLVFSPGLYSAVAGAPLSTTWAVMYLGIFPGAIAYITWGRVLGAAKVAHAASTLYLIPALAILIGWLWLREVPSALAFVGGAIAFAGVLLVNTKGRETAPALAEVRCESAD